MRLNFHNSLTFFALVVAAGVSYQPTANATQIDRIENDPTPATFNDEFMLPQVSFNRQRQCRRAEKLRKRAKRQEFISQRNAKRNPKRAKKHSARA